MTAAPSTEAELVPFVASLSLVRPGLTTAGDVLRAVSGLAVEQGYVRASFLDAVVARERLFPTGLPTPLPVAIPHADAEHVVRPGLAAVTLDPPVDFGEMGGSGEVVAVRLVVVLLVDDPGAQAGLLSRLVAALRRPDLERVVAAGHDPSALVAGLSELVHGGAPVPSTEH